ncbi:hypothetical protein [Cesiribacter sp. SM1]|uniref:hypothetical protein n=1 Tax=Cesiribacter sp. SM1 TaxID=2861196 RepID=UPI001CD496E0|nr:hypothetical protein [Cesiribacter sp. SM1]
MKQIILSLFIIACFSSCVKKQLSNSISSDTNQQASAAVQGESLTGKINEKSLPSSFDENALILLNGRRISREEFELLNPLKSGEIKEIKALPKEEAVRLYGKDGEHGALLITPLIDETLSQKYYEGLNNSLLLEKIQELESQGKINSNPLLVLNGIPLRGEEIVERINALGEEGIGEINLLVKKTAYAIYGVRAMNGVLLIDSK